MKLTKSQLRKIIQEEIRAVLDEDAEKAYERDQKEKEEKEDVVEEKKKKNWMKGIKSTGECTPYTKPGCKGRARAYAKRAQQGDIHKDNLKKGKNPHGPG